MGKKKNFGREFWVGLIGVVALLSIYLLINFFKGINIFKMGENYYVRFNNVSELVNSSPVYLNGFKAGNVQSINYDYNDMESIIVELSIDKKLHIPVGSVAKISTHMLGGADISIIMSKSAEFYQPGDTLVGILDKGIAGEANDKIIPAMNNLLPKLDSILVSTNKLLANPALTASIKNAEEITSELTKTAKLMNDLLGDDVPHITERLIGIEDDLLDVSSQLSEIDYKQMIHTLDSTISNIHTISETLLEAKGTAGMLLNDSSLYLNLNATCEEATKLLTDLREHPKRYVHFSIFGKKDK